jgi:ubiquinone/menaquinone biosynthesis C-methylase UbiE
MEKNLKDLFDSAAFVKMYKVAEQFTGFYALELIKRSSFKQDLSKLDKLVVLDNACGTAVVSSHLMSMMDDSNASKIDLTCADYADAMINATQQRIDSTPWPNAKVVKADAQVSSPSLRRQ